MIFLVFAFLIYFGLDSSNKLSHVIIPLHYTQISKLFLIYSNRSLYLPCKEKTSVSLIVLLTGHLNLSIENEIYFELNKSILTTSCFRSIKIQWAELSGNNNSYAKGTYIMFENVLKKQYSLSSASYVFWMEPDCIPIKSFWLDAAIQEVSLPNLPFWIKGSQFRGADELLPVNITGFQVHINGNAIYNLLSSSFKKFYFF